MKRNGRMGNKVVYALYRGDTFIDVGTAFELAEKLNIRVKTLREYATPRHKNRNGDGGYIAVRIGKEADFREEEN